MIVRSVGPLSFAKVFAILYGLIGVVVGLICGLMVFVIPPQTPIEPTGRLLFGAVVLVGSPIAYAGIGFLSSLLMSGLYNWVAGRIGGVEIHFDEAAQGMHSEVLSGTGREKQP